MGNSNYYYELMVMYGRKKRKLEEKKISYESFITKLNDVKNRMSSPKEMLSSSYNTFKNGGYNDGETPSRGRLSQVCVDIDSAISLIETIISNTQAKIDNFVKEISTLKLKYDEVQKNYNSANS